MMVRLVQTWWGPQLKADSRVIVVADIVELPGDTPLDSYAHWW